MADHHERPRNIAWRFHDSATRHPERIAVVWEGGEVRYGELQRTVDALRAVLPGLARIGVLAKRGPAGFAAVQAILSNGAAYVPMKPTSPARHNLSILQLSGISAVVVDAECAESLSELLALHQGPLTVVACESGGAIRTVTDRHPDVDLLEPRQELAIPPAGPADPIDGSAYILFTSGSTGTPKGVVGTHTAVGSYLDSFLAAYPITAADRLAQNSDLTFDPTVHDQFVAWSSGSALVLIPDRQRPNPLEFARRHEVTIWNSVAGLPSLLEGAGPVEENALPRVRLSIFGGEKLTWNAVQTWKRIAPASRAVNMYGPTEATIAITHFEVPREFPESACHQGIVPIGKPFPGQSTEILRGDGSVCAPLEEGVLWLAGDQLTAGYLDPSMAAGRFVERSGRLWYRTGDLVFATREGEIQFLGREDNQVKVNGYRIELGEIEAALLRESGASFAVAEVARLRGNFDEIVCVLPTAFASRKKFLREALRGILEPHKLPKIWKFQDDLPLNSNGKIDRQALKASWKPLPGWEE